MSNQIDGGYNLKLRIAMAWVFAHYPWETAYQFTGAHNLTNIIGVGFEETCDNKGGRIGIFF